MGSKPAIDPMLMINPSFSYTHLLCQQMIQATSHVRLAYGPEYTVTWNIRYLTCGVYCSPAHYNTFMTHLLRHQTAAYIPLCWHTALRICYAGRMHCMSCATLLGLDPLSGNSCKVKGVAVQVAVLHGYGQTSFFTGLPAAMI